MAESVAGRKQDRRIATLVALAVVFVILCGLGTWQVERLAWKEGLIASIEARRHGAPIDVATALERAKSGEIDYTAITVEGRFRHDAERYFLATHDGMPGYFVYTPLVLDGGKAVFVNRGFVPDQMKDPATRQDGQTPDTVSVTGLARARLDSKPSSLVPDNEPAKNLFFWKDLNAMASGTGIEPANLLPFFVDAGEAPNPGGWPKGGVTQIDLPNNHLSYAVTWYGLAAVLVVIAVLAFRRQSR